MVAALDPFSMYMLTTGPGFLKGEEAIINALVRNSYLLPRFLEGKEMGHLLQGGTKIQDIIYLQEDSDAEFYSSDQQDFQYRNQQVGTAWEVDWRFLVNKTSWTDHETLLNESGGMGDAVGMFHRYKRIGRLRYMNLWTTQIHKMEDALVSTPNRDLMEDGVRVGASAPVPYSLGCFITGESSAGNTGLPNTGASSGAWTTLQKVGSPHVGTLTGKWRNQTATYAISGVNATLQPESWWTGMRELHSKCKFERLPRFGSYSEPSRSPSFYACSLWGLICAESSMRSENDAYLAGRQDPSWPAPMFHGVPYVYISSLNQAIMYNATSDVTKLYREDGGGTVGSTTGVVGGVVADADFHAGPRVMAINGAVLSMIMHKQRVMKQLPPFSPDRSPFMKVMVTDSWYNLCVQNRRELGLLQPDSATAGDDLAIPAPPTAGV